VGVGFINPPLASTAIGVVEPQKSGMASGINSTFRQIGISTGIALLGTLFTSRLGSAVHSLAAGTPLSGQSTAIAHALQNGQVQQLFGSTPAAQRAVLAHVARGGFTTALNEIILVGALIALASGVVAFALIRSRDFTSHAAHSAPAH
jgi:hypothetical protein